MSENIFSVVRVTNHVQPHGILCDGVAQKFTGPLKFHVVETTPIRPAAIAAFFWPIQGSQGCLDVAKRSPARTRLDPGIWHRKRAYFGKRGLLWGFFPREPSRGVLRGFPGRNGIQKRESGPDSGLFSHGGSYLLGSGSAKGM
jgi:hypothetical protein